MTALEQRVCSSAPTSVAFVAVRKEDVPGDRFRPLIEIAVVLVDASTFELVRVLVITLRPVVTTFSTWREPDGGVQVIDSAPRTMREAMTEFLDVIGDSDLAVWGDAVRDAVEWGLFDADLRWRGDAPRLLDVPSLAWPTLGHLPESPAALAEALGIDPPSSSALGLAWWMKRAVERQRDAHALGARIARFGGDEAKIAGHVIGRLELGLRAYGPFDVARDQRNFPKETTEELIDGLIYLAAGVERLDRANKGAGRSRPAVLCVHGSGVNAGRIAAQVLAEGAAPIAAELVLAQFVKDGMPPALAQRMLVDGCDEVRVYGGELPAPLRELVAYARTRGVPVRGATQGVS
jgi:hypothetical protein